MGECQRPQLRSLQLRQDAIILLEKIHIHLSFVNNRCRHSFYRRLALKTIKTNEDYQQFVQDKQPKQTLLKNCINAFLWGGLICVIGEAIMDAYIFFGLEKDAA